MQFDFILYIRTELNGFTWFIIYIPVNALNRRNNRLKRYNGSPILIKLCP